MADPLWYLVPLTCFLGLFWLVLFAAVVYRKEQK